MAIDAPTRRMLPVLAAVLLAMLSLLPVQAYAADEAALGDDVAASNAALASDDASNGSDDTENPNAQQPNLGADYTDDQWAYAGSNVDKDGTYSMHVPGWNEYNEDGTPKDNAEGIVVVMDSGVDYTNPDLDDVMVDLTKEPVIKGYEGKYGKYGYDAVDAVAGAADTTDPMDEQGHGTHVAGSIAAEWNGQGVSGIASGVKIMAVRNANAQGAVQPTASAEAFRFVIAAAESGLHIVAVNCSWGGTFFDSDVAAYVKKLGELGVVTVFSSLNNSTDNDVNASTPGSLWDSPYVIVVNALNYLGNPATFTNTGKGTTDVYAPGVDILSTALGKNYGYDPKIDNAPQYTQDFSSDTTDLGFGKSGSTTAFDVEVKDGSLSVGVASLLQNGGATVRDGSVIVILSLASTDATGNPTASLDGYVSFRVKLPESVVINFNTALSVGIDVQTVTGEYMTAVGDTNMWIRSEGNGWYLVSGSIKHAADAVLPQLQAAYPGKFAPDADMRLGNYAGTGRTIFQLIFSAEGVKQSDRIYFDDVVTGAGGNSGVVPYMLMSGTSMATPAVTGAVAVVAKMHKAELQGLTPSQRAARTVELVRSMVRVDTNLTSTSRSGGEVDFAYANGPYNPVLNTGEVVDGGMTFVIEGVNFGREKGTVTIDGMDAMIFAWSDATVKVKIPAGIYTGAHNVELTCAAPTNARTVSTRSARNTFPFDMPQDSTPLYDTTWPIQDVVVNDSNGVPWIIEALFGEADGSKLYAVVSYETQRLLTVLDLATGTWSLSPLDPAYINASTFAALNGTIYDAYRGTDGVLYVLKLSDDLQHGAVVEKSSDLGLTSGQSTLVAANGSLYLVMSSQMDASHAGNEIYLLDCDPATSPILAGTTPRALAGVSVSAYGSRLYVRGKDSSGTEYLYLMNVNADGSVTSSGSNLFASFLTDYLPNYRARVFEYFAAYEEGVALAARYVTANPDADTYLIKYDGTVEALGKRASHYMLDLVTSAYVAGQLFVAGGTYYENGGLPYENGAVTSMLRWILRSVVLVEHPVTPIVDPIVEPVAQEVEAVVAQTASALADAPRTGDSTSFAALLAFLLAIAATLLLASHRHREVTKGQSLRNAK